MCAARSGTPCAGVRACRAVCPGRMTRTASELHLPSGMACACIHRRWVAAGKMGRLRKRQCPFLSDALEQETRCVKKANSSGVCTITTTNLGMRDWVVCPYRVLERRIVSEVARIVFSDPREEVAVYPVVHLEEESRRSRIFDLASRETVYLFFQDKLGGEINISRIGHHAGTVI